jgi:hypothetical protein
MTRSARFRFLDRFTPAIALTSMIALLTSGLTACEFEQLDESDTELADAGDDSDEFRSLEQMAAAVSVDPLFQQMLERSVELTAQRMEAQALMTDEELDAFARTIGDPNYPTEEIDLEAFAEATGVDQTLVTDQMQLAQQLISKYQLGGLTSAQIEAVFSAAAATEANQNFVKGAIEYELEQLDDPEPNDPEVDQCESVCAGQYAVTVAIALQAYVAALAAATLAGPAWPILVAAATAAYAYALAEAQGQVDDCIAICNGEIITDEECLYDSDCASNEYCWTGVLGWGENECRTEKTQGTTCSRHGQCISGCCKLHVWTNPFSKTCRPADACD